jgi:hypothetical protein
MAKKIVEWQHLIKDLKNIQKLPLEIWRYILDISNIHYMPWKLSMNRCGFQEDIKKHLSKYIWGTVYNRYTELYTVKVFTRYYESYLIFGGDNPNRNEHHILNKKIYTIVSNFEMNEYIMTNISNNKILF